MSGCPVMQQPQLQGPSARAARLNKAASSNPRIQIEKDSSDEDEKNNNKNDNDGDDDEQQSRAGNNRFNKNRAMSTASSTTEAVGDDYDVAATSTTLSRLLHLMACRISNRCQQRLQLVQVFFIGLVALAGIAVQVYTEADLTITKSATVKIDTVALHLLANVQEVALKLTNEAVAFINGVNIDYDIFLQAAIIETQATDEKLFWIDDWLTDDDMRYVETSMRDAIATPATLLGRVKAHRLIRKTQNATTELLEYAFYYPIIASLLISTRHIMERVNRFPGWGELRTSQFLLNTDIFGKLTTSFAKIFCAKKQEKRVVSVFDVDNEMLTVLSSLFILYEKNLEVAMLNSAFSKEILSNNLTQQEFYTEFAATYRRVVASTNQTLAAKQIELAWAPVELALNWYQALFRNRIATAVVSRSYWTELTTFSAVMLGVSVLLSVLSLISHVAGTKRLQRQLANCQNAADMLIKVSGVIHDYIPRRAQKLLVKGIGRSLLFLPRPTKITDLCVVVVDVQNMLELLTASNNTKLEVTKAVQLLTRYFETVEETVTRFDCYKVDVIGECCCIASLPDGYCGLRAMSADPVRGMTIMALNLLERISEINVHEQDQEDSNNNKIRSEDVFLLPRIGIHVGPALAHLLNLSVPRLSVFGEAIELASIMNATCLPCQVHASASVFDRMVTGAGMEFIFHDTIHLEDSYHADVEAYWVIPRFDDDAAFNDTASSVSYSNAALSTSSEIGRRSVKSRNSNKDNYNRNDAMSIGSITSTLLQEFENVFFTNSVTSSVTTVKGPV